MYVYCVYTAMQCIHKILIFTHKNAKTFDNLLEFPFECLRHVLYSSRVCFPSLYIRGRVPGNFIHLVEIKSKGLYVHLYIGSKYTDCSIKRCIKT